MLPKILCFSTKLTLFYLGAYIVLAGCTIGGTKGIHYYGSTPGPQAICASRLIQTHLRSLLQMTLQIVLPITA